MNAPKSSGPTSGMGDRRRRMIEYGLVLLVSIATATVLVVADRADQQGTAPAAPASQTSTTIPTTVTGRATATTTTPAPPASTTLPPTKPPPTTTPSTSGAPATPLPAELLGRDVERLPTSSKVVALTFDAGANADGVAPILATLRREGVRATFFLTGGFATTFGGVSAQIVAGGHRVANHSVSHPHFPALSDQAIRAELSGAEQAIRGATGRDPRPLFRFPYGDRDQRTIATVNGAGYLAIRWTVDSLGWKGTSGGMTAAAAAARVVAARTPGEIVLMHVGSNPDDHTTLDADALPSVIAQLRSAGYTFVTLDALLT